MAIKDLRQKLNAIISEPSAADMRELNFRLENREWLTRSFQIALLVLHRLDELGWSQKALAEKLEVSPQQVNKIVKGSENLSLSTIAKLEGVLGISLIAVNLMEVADRATIPYEVDVVESNVSAQVSWEINEMDEEMIIQSVEDFLDQWHFTEELKDTQYPHLKIAS